MGDKNITFILTLNGRDEFTKRLLKFLDSTSFPYKIIIGDGAVSSPIKELLTGDKKFKNVGYEYYEFEDKTPKDFFHKILNLLQKVTTPYVMLIDNDDYVLAESINKCTEFLDHHPDYVSCGGSILGFQLIQNKDRKIIINEKLLYSPLSIEQEEPLERAIFYTKNYMMPCWYNVYRIESLIKSFDFFIKGEIYDFLLMEYFLAISTAIEGKHKFYKSFPHYIRQTNSSSCNTKIKSFFHRIMFSNLYEETKKTLEILSNQITNNSVEINETQVQDEIFNSYVIYLENSNKFPDNSISYSIKDFYKRYLYTFRYLSKTINNIFRIYDAYIIKDFFIKSGADQDEVKKFFEIYSHICQNIVSIEE